MAVETSFGVLQNSLTCNGIMKQKNASDQDALVILVGVLLVFVIIDLTCIVMGGCYDLCCMLGGGCRV